MVIPTLLVKGSLVPLNPKVKKEDLDDYVAIHYILELIRHKLEKSAPNIHDRIFLLNSLVGSGKTTAFIVEVYRRFFNGGRQIPDSARDYRNVLNADFTVYDFPDDKYTKKNREKPIQEITKQSQRILCAQPKVLSAISKATEIATEPFNPDLELYRNVGYNTGSFKSPIDYDNHIMYCTMGTMTQMLKNKPDIEWMQHYGMIVVDECHERSLELDEGASYIRKLLQRNAGNPAFPLVVFMSATFDIKKYAKFFGTYPENAVYVTVGKISRDFIYLEEDSKMIYLDTAEKAYKLHKENPDDPDDHCDILVFGPGDGELKNIIGNLRKLDKDKELYITKITSETNSKGGPEMDFIMKKTMDDIRTILKNPNIKRRVIIATPVVETSVTIPTLKYVIDTCMVKATAYSPIYNLAQLLTQPCSKSSLEQRAGRVGRVKFGYVHRMIRPELIEGLDDYARPDMFTKDLSKILLDMMYAGLDYEAVQRPISKATFELFLSNCTDVPGFKLTKDTEYCKCIYNDVFTKKAEIKNSKSFVNDITLQTFPNKMLDPVPTDVFIMARNKLISLGFYGTYIGYLASKISRLSVEATRMVMAGSVYGVSINDLITIGIFVDVGEKKYKYSKFDIEIANRLGDKIKPFRSDKLLETVYTKQTLTKHFGGNSDLLTNQLHDDFFEPLYLMKWYANTVRKVGPLKAIEKGKAMGIDVVKMYKLIDCRAKVQEAFKKVGIVPTAPEIDFNADDCFDQMIRIKKCIHAGYKNNLAYLTDNGFQYKTNTNLTITPKEFYVKFKPKKIIFGYLFMNVKSDSIYYDPTPSYLCAMDGII